MLPSLQLLNVARSNDRFKTIESARSAAGFGRLLPLPGYELVAVVRRSSIPGVKLYFSFTSLREPVSAFSIKH
jgi:hypothetical protein